MSSPVPPPGWNPPTQYPAPKKRNTVRIVLFSVLAAGVLCVGGLATLGAILGEPSKTGTSAPVAPLADVPSSGSAVEPVVTTEATVAPTTVKPNPTTAKPRTTTPKPTTKKPKPKPTTEAPEDVYYANCAAVRAASADPIHRGDPGYSRKLDRDGDGVGCE